MHLAPRSAALAAAALTVAALAGPTPAVAAPAVHGAPQVPVPVAAGRYLNLHQCVYNSPLGMSNFDLMTTLVPSQDGRFTSATNVSDTPTPADAVCGPADGNYERDVYTAAQPYDLTSGRYLNLHQCIFWSAYNQDHLTTVVPGSYYRIFSGTNISNSRDTTPFCGDGGADPLQSFLSGPTSLDLTAGRYLNLHQCMYYFTGYRDHLTTFGTSPDGRFNAGTNVSDTPDTKPSCGPGDGNYRLIPLLSGVKALPIG